MSIKIKTEAEIERMRIAGKLAADVLEMIGPHVKAGVTTEELDRICHEFTLANGAYPAPLNYGGFPKSICTSINHIVCHGIPASADEMGTTGKSKPAVLKDGDIVNIDITVIIPDEDGVDLSERPNGYHGDTSKMFFVGEVSPADKRLCLVAQESLYLAMKKVKPGATVGDIGTAIEKIHQRKQQKEPSY